MAIMQYILPTLALASTILGKSTSALSLSTNPFALELVSRLITSPQPSAAIQEP